MSQNLANTKQQAFSLDTLETCFQCGQKKALREFLVSDNQSDQAQFSTICVSCRGQLAEQEQNQALSSAHIGDINIEQQQLADPELEQRVLKEIRQEEAQRFGHVDESTHKTKLQHDLANDETLNAMPGAKQHPILAESPYFSGIDDNANNPDYTVNEQAEQEYKNELKHQHQKQHQQQQQFNPTPNGPGQT